VLPIGGDARSRLLAPIDDVVDLTKVMRETDEDLMRCLHCISFIYASS
jgi:hypothetical protein